MAEVPITLESIVVDCNFLKLIPKDIQDAFLLASSKVRDDMSSQTLRLWLVARLTDTQQDEGLRILVLQMLVCIWKGEDWLRETLAAVVLEERKFEAWYFRSLIMSAFTDYWPHEPWMRDLFRKLLDNRLDDCLVRSGAECRLSCFWNKEEWLPERLREIVLSPKEDGEVQFNVIRSLAEYWKSSPWFRTTLEHVMFSRKHDVSARGQAAYRLLKVFGQTDWLKELFSRILTEKEQGESRLEFLRIVCENWSNPTWINDHVMEMLFDRKNKVFMKSQILDHYAKIWTGDEESRTRLSAFLNDKRQNKELMDEVRQKFSIS
jgi:hypothetical protein